MRVASEFVASASVAMRHLLPRHHLIDDAVGVLLPLLREVQVQQMCCSTFGLLCADSGNVQQVTELAESKTLGAQ
jgi:hypothetical protein